VFDTCKACRRRLALRSEGRLPRSQWSRLEAHLAQCRDCRRIDEADRALHLALSRSHYSYFSMTRDRAEAFDDRVMNMVLNERQSLLSRLLESLADRWRILRRALADSMASQVAAGAVVAAAGAACFLAISAHPGRLSYTHTPNYKQASLTRFLTSPPIPVSSLGSSDSPRQAILWAPPADNSRPTFTAPSTSTAPTQQAPILRESNSRGKF
jgi:hypothetical protein